MQIFITKPGGQKQGPYTLDQINRDLAAGKYRDTDFWAWHEGLAEWIPLYSLPGVSTRTRGIPAGELKPIRAEPVNPEAAPPAQSPTSGGPEPLKPASPTAVETKTAPKPVAASQPPARFSGQPFHALAQVFVLTTGEGPATFKSEATTALLQTAAGESLAVIRAKVPVDVIGRAAPAVLESIRDGAIPDSAWRALAGIRPEAVHQARAGAYQVCIRTLPLDSPDSVAVLLLYAAQPG